ncbi:MAG: hypothetical protein H6738_12430 [Alphaproteobacteria bacterium]|nr:hypothetical protein [Alphaproteobacteria bacterium]
MELDQLEALALSDDRDAAVAALVPGTEDHDYWAAIRAQHLGDLDAVDQILARWRSRHGDGSRRQALELRQAVLRADADLSAHADALAELLDVSLDHAREVEHEAAPHPTALDPSLLDTDALLADALRRDRTLGGVHDEGLPAVLRRAGLSSELRRLVLSRWRRPAEPELVAAIAAELGESASKGFGSLAAHQSLTLRDLDDLAGLVPSLRTDRAWVHARLTRLRPASHVDLEDLDARTAHLDLLWSEVTALPPTFGELKAHVLAHRLQIDRERGVVDRDRVLAWLALPRRASYANPRWLERQDRRHLAGLSEDFSSVTGLGRTPEDEPLLRPMLAELLRHEDTSAFADLVERRWLDVLLAETRLLDGDPDVERWTTILGPSATTSLRERVDIELQPTNRRRYAADEPVAIDVELKNAWPLRIRLYRMNTAAWAASRGGDVPLDVDLDGLAAGDEQLVTTAPVPPMRRVHQRIELPAADRPGTWVVELVGQGRASRMLLHKGHLRCVTRPTAAGLELRVLDGEGRLRPEARVHLGGRVLLPDEQGLLRLPFGTRGEVDAVLVDGDLAVPTRVVLPAEEPAFRVRAMLDRQSLVATREIEVLLRPELRIGESPAAMDLLEEPWVEVTTVDRAGVAARRRQPMVWVDDGETALPLTVPEHVASLSLAFGGRLRLVTQQRHQDLRHDVVLEVGTMDATDATEALVLARSTQGYELRLLGKTGEPRPGRAVVVTLDHRWVTAPIECTLATDERGAIRLGALPGVRAIHARSARWDLGPVSASCSRQRVVRQGDRVALAAASGPDGETPSARVVELRGGAPARDHSATAGSEPGLVRLGDLPVGEVRVHVGEEVHDLRVLPRETERTPGVAAVGDELVELTSAPTLLAEVRPDAAGLVIRVENATPATRVHVLATPFWPLPVERDELGGPTPGPRVQGSPRRRAAWVSGRDIGDEARYVLDRRTLPRRPGTLLERPSLLIQPWALRSTTTSVATPLGATGWAGSAAPPPPAAAPRRSMAREEARKPAPVADDAFVSWTFLEDAPTPIADLRPDEHGVVRVSAADLGSGPVVRVVCVDPSATTRQTLALAPVDPTTRDLRLAEALPDDRHQREERLLVAARAGEALSVAGARVAVVDTIEPLYRALCAVSEDADLASWDFLARWGRMTREARLEAWDRHACHELALFVKLKDPDLFAELRPTLACKLEPTFLDRWLLDEDLSDWLAPDRLARLNALERALLARALPAARSSLVRALADEVDLLVPDRSADDRFVDTLLAGGDAPEEEEPPEPSPSDDDGFGGPPMEAAAEVDLFLDLEEEADEEPAPRARMAKAKRAMPQAPGGGGRDSSGDKVLREDAAPLYRGADQTKEWAEHRWWHTRLADQGLDVIAVGRLWRDLAAHDQGPFLPAHLADATSSFAASVAALALVDLPFEAPRSRNVGGTLTLAADALVATAALRPMEGEPTGEVLVGQGTFRSDDRWEWEGGERREKPVGAELLTGVVYVTEVVVTNPTARTRRLSALVQIPQGAVTVNGGLPTRTTRLDLAPYATTTVAVSWVFPHPGSFRQAGARISAGERLVAAAPSRTFAVVRVPTASDATSWAHVSQQGTLDEVVAYLRGRALGQQDLSRVAWRLRDPEAFRRVWAALRERHVFDEVIGGYALLHRDRDATRVWLSRNEHVVRRVGPLACDLLAVDPVDRGLEEQLEYAPLVNARAHRLGTRRTVLNDGLASRWRAFLDRVATRPSPTPEDRLIAAQALFTMDRTDEAAAQLAKAPRTTVRSVLQHDWLSAWAALLAGDLSAARTSIAPWVDHPVPRWRKRMSAIAAMLDEVEAGAAPPTADRDDRDAVMAELASRHPALAARLEGDVLVLDTARLERAEVRAYGMDLELLFSRQPFLDAGSDRFTLIDPGSTTAVALDPSGRTRWPLPDTLRRADAVLEVVAGSLRAIVTHFANDLAVTVSAAYGQLQVRRASTGEPLPSAYVKTFGRARGGAVSFYKDGYTDLRGRFDYATLSTDDLDRVERFALLILHDEAGGTVLQSEPPTR